MSIRCLLEDTEETYLERRVLFNSLKYYFQKPHERTSNIYYCLSIGNTRNESNEAEVGNLTALHIISFMSHDWKTEGDDTTYSRLQMIYKKSICISWTFIFFTNYNAPIWTFDEICYYNNRHVFNKHTIISLVISSQVSYSWEFYTSNLNAE